MLVGKKTDMRIAEHSSTSVGIHAQRNQVFSSLESMFLPGKKRKTFLVSENHTSKYRRGVLIED